MKEFSEENVREFLARYEAICKEFGMVISGTELRDLYVEELWTSGGRIVFDSQYMGDHSAFFDWCNEDGE